MPAAIQNCHGSQRLVAVRRFRDDDMAECSFCTARRKSERRTENQGRDLYYVIPAHRPAGEKDPSKIDWSQVD